MKELQSTIESLVALDNNVEFIMIFLNQPERHFDLVDTTLKHTIGKLFDPSLPINHMHMKYDQAINLLNDQWWNYPYPLHDSHFHKSFEAFCNCPFTSLTEIIDVMTKVLYGKLQ